MTRRGKTISLRTMLVAIALAGVVYVLTLILEIAVVIAPTAGTLRGHAGQLLTEHDAIRQHLQTLRTSLNRVLATFDTTVARGTALDRARALSLTGPITGRLDSAVAIRTSLQVSAAPPAMRLSLANAVETETSAGLSMLDAVRAMEAGRTADAAASLRRAELQLDSTALHLESAQGSAISSLLAREDRLLDSTQMVSRWAIGWGILGAALIGLTVWLVRVRVYRPIADLESAVARVTSGDLSSDARVERDDELGRLAGHFNTMTSALRERVEQDARRRVNLTERFGRILDESSNEIYLFDVATLRFVQANRGVLANLGYSLEELSALTPLDVLRDVDQETVETALTSLKNGEQQSVVLTCSQQRKNGSLYPVEIRLQLSEAGDPPVYVAVVEDVSERSRVRELNQRLRQFAFAEQRLLGRGDLPAALRKITELAADTLVVARAAVWAHHPDTLACLDSFDRSTREHTSGAELRWEHQPSFFAAIREGVPVAVADARHDDRTREIVARSDVTARFDIPVRAGGRVVAVLTNEHVGGPRRWTAEEQTFASSVASFVALAIEAAERNRLEEQLAKAQKMDSIGRLAGGVAHDFNNLLTAILGNVEIARTSLAPDVSAHAELHEIEKAARRAADLSRQLLTFARNQVVQARVVDLNELTRGADKLLRRLLGEDVELVTLLAPELGSVRIDPGQFEQVIVNLAVNARDAMPDGGRLTIETSNIVLGREYAASHTGIEPGEYVQLAVSDTGQGMDRETLSRLFEPFFTTKGQGKGTGLGLAICYGIVRQAGGAIWAYSEPGRGATFKVHLPKVDAVPDVEEVVDVALAAPRGRETILLVEDEGQIRQLAARALEAQGYTVIVAADGTEGVRLGREHLHEIDALVTDVVLPMLGGREVAMRLRQDRPGLPVLFMSGYTRGAIPDSEGHDRLTGFLSKPFTPRALAERVREILDRAASVAKKST
jgi:two-component system, cell cycle sensor histidine kinase and response regulator CckA